MEIQARSQAANLSGGCNRLEDQGPGSVATDKDTMGEAFVQSVRKMREEAEAGVALRARAAARIAAQSKVGESADDFAVTLTLPVLTVAAHQ